VISTYSWSGGAEPMLWSGPSATMQIIMLQPLFEEANRMRKTLVDVQRGLYANGFGVALPDLPGTGESLAPLTDQTFDDWQRALKSLVVARRDAGQTVILASFRGATLIDSSVDCDGVWRLAQETGARLLRDISRTVLARNAALQGDAVYDRAGYALPLGFVAALEIALPQPVQNLRSVRLLQDPNEADARIAGAPLWRRSEPDEDPVMTQAIIDDISAWTTQCAA